MLNRILPVLLIAGCGKSAAPDNSGCEAQVKGLAPWLASLELERRSQEIDFGYKLQVIARDPMPVTTHVDNVEITADRTRVFDISEHDHATSHPGTVAERLAAIRAMKAGPDEFEPSPDDLLRIDVDQQAPWSAVVEVVDAATKAGYARVVFGFTATPTVARPAAMPASVATEQAAREASDKLEAVQNQCKAYARAAMHVPARGLSPAEDAAAHGKQLVAALLECKCTPDPEELRRLMWLDTRWHQAKPRVGVTIALDAAAPSIALPATTPWSEAHAKILAATGPVKLIAN